MITLTMFSLIRNEAEYDQAVEVLNTLLDEVGTNEQHPLYGMLDTLGAVMYAYEEKHHPMPEASGADMLDFFMVEHDLSLDNLPELGPAKVIQEILAGQRELTIPQIRGLAKRFHVSPAVFI